MFNVKQRNKAGIIARSVSRLILYSHWQILFYNMFSIVFMLLTDTNKEQHFRDWVLTIYQIINKSPDSQFHWRRSSLVMDLSSTCCRRVKRKFCCTFPTFQVLHILKFIVGKQFSVGLAMISYTLALLQDGSFQQCQSKCDSCTKPGFVS